MSRILLIINISANALSNIDEKYPYGKIKFLSATLISAMMILGLGIGFYLLDFGTDLSFSADMNQMSSMNRNTTKYEGCWNKTEELELKKKFNVCFQSNDRRENFKCLDFLNKLQQEARNCFNREQHFESENLKQFTYMRIGLILIF